MDWFCDRRHPIQLQLRQVPVNMFAQSASHLKTMGSYGTVGYRVMAKGGEVWKSLKYVK